MSNEESLITSRCCGCDCDYKTKGEPCWGAIMVVDEVVRDDGDGGTTWEWVHACDGHRSGTYTPPEMKEQSSG